MPFNYANPTSGPSAGGIGWFDFGSLTMNPGDTITDLTGTLNDGSTITFDLTATNISGAPRVFAAAAVPTYVGANFGNTGYTGIDGNVAMQTNLSFLPGANQLTISNIVVLDSQGNPVPNYTVIVADSESTGFAESWTWQTNAEPWQQLAKLGNQLSPTLAGVGTQIATISGTNSAVEQASYVLSTQNPTQLTLTTATTNTAGGRQAVSIGFATTRIRLAKYVAGRIDDADQFTLDITGTPADQVTTTGIVSGLQSEIAEIYAIPDNVYTINEIMAVGSVSLLSDYTTIVSAFNETPAGSAPPLGNLPINFTPQLGDDATYILYNAVPFTYKKTVDKAYADIGDILTYTVVIDNPNDIPATNVEFTDPTPSGTTYIGNLFVTSPYTGTDPNSGLVITSIAAGGSVTISWQVRINTAPPIPTPIVNVADITIPGGNSGMTNLTTTDIRTAYVTMQKAVDKVFAQPNEILTYTLTLNNSGNVVANNVVITDILPTGVTFVPGSLTGATGNLPNLTLNAPLAAGGTATVTYQVKIGAVVPNPNPILNNASANFVYTVDPAIPNGKTGTTQSNTVTTFVQVAKLSITKSADRLVSYLGDTITYKLAVKNTGNIPVNNVIITDVLTVGTVYVAGSLAVNVPSTGDPTTAITLTNPIASGETVSITFKATVASMPNPNPIQNKANATFTYSLSPETPDSESGTSQSNTVVIPVFRNNFEQELNDVIQSVAQQQAALAAIANGEGAKIQRIAAMEGVTQETLLCINKSVADMLDSITMLEAILKQKLSLFNCQINGESC